MWNKLKRWLSTERAAPESGGQNYALKWYDPGPDNPFGIRILDCRSMTWSLLSTTGDPAVAESYLRLRSTTGRELISRAINDSVRCQTSLRFPHNGARLEGVVFKADSMEVKWDIYIYDSVFLFARSWTGELQFRAWATISASEIHITEIECSKDDRDLAAGHVYFLIGTHAMKRVLPHRVPCEPSDDPIRIATVSFALFGKLACYAAFEDITAIPIARPPAPQ